MAFARNSNRHESRSDYLVHAEKALHKSEKTATKEEKTGSPRSATSPAQARLMAAAAHSPTVARQSGVKPTVAKHFNKADQVSGYLAQAAAKLQSKNPRSTARSRLANVHYQR